MKNYLVNNFKILGLTFCAGAVCGSLGLGWRLGHLLTERPAVPRIETPIRSNMTSSPDGWPVTTSCQHEATP